MKPLVEPVQIVDCLVGLKSVLILSHYNPDADAYGSSLGLGLGLRALGIKVRFLNESGIIPRYDFLSGINEVVTAIPSDTFDAVIACDCGDEKRMGDTLKDQLLKSKVLINIDHHASNTRFGTLNMVVAHASSTSELIFNLLSLIQVKTGKKVISSEVATCLFAGISADTGSFRYASTAPSTFKAAQDLMGYGAQPWQVAEALYCRNSLSSVMLQAEALTTLTTHASGRIAKVVVPDALLKKHHATADDTEELVERARNIAGVEISVFIREEDGIWKASLRAKNASTDVSKVAQQFGGGGHKAAAGFRWKKSREELENALLPELEKLLSK